MSDKEESFSPATMLRCVFFHGALAVGIILILLALTASAISGGLIPLESRLVPIIIAEFLGVLFGSFRAAKKVHTRKLPTGFLTGLAVFLCLLGAGFLWGFPPAGHSIFLLITAVFAALSGSMLSDRSRRKSRRSH